MDGLEDSYNLSSGEIFTSVFFCMNPYMYVPMLNFLYAEKSWKKFEYGKVHIFWEGHKILWNLPLTFDYSSKGKISQNFVAHSLRRL